MELYLQKDKSVQEGIFFDCHNTYNTDIDIYDKITGDIILSFKKKVIEEEYYDFHKGIVSQSRILSMDRGNAAGKTTIAGLKQHKENWKTYPVELLTKNGEHQEESKVSGAYYRYNDGRVSKRSKSNSVRSSTIGGFDKNARNPCRLTYFTKNNIDKYQTIFPISQKISDLYFSYFPDRWLYQYESYSKCPENFIIPNTNFSSITLNHDFRTASHRDKGDYKKGLTCFTVKKCGKFSGGELCFPEYGIGVNVEQGDLLMFNPHEVHCNNALNGDGRMSMVFYLREKMELCK
tara:strand:- start:2695 stop:3567 length:873 start_codon:yes stop_codon:yes gene_type:complete